MMKDKYNTKPAAYSIIISPISRFFNYLLQIIDHIKLLPSTKTYLFYFKNRIFLPFFFFSCLLGMRNHYSKYEI